MPRSPSGTATLWGVRTIGVPRERAAVPRMTARIRALTLVISVVLPLGARNRCWWSIHAPPSEAVKVVAYPVERLGIAHQVLGGSRISAAPVHERLGTPGMIGSDLFDVRATWVRARVHAESLRRVAQGPQHEISECLGLFALPSQEVPHRLDVVPTPVGELVGGLAIQVRPGSYGMR